LVRRRLRPPATDEPDALIGHVRVCGGSGGQPLLLPGSPTRIIHVETAIRQKVEHEEGKSKDIPKQIARGSQGP
jgi:hypothetical protein